MTEKSVTWKTPLSAILFRDDTSAVVSRHGRNGAETAEIKEPVRFTSTSFSRTFAIWTLTASQIWPRWKWPRTADRRPLPRTRSRITHRSPFCRSFLFIHAAGVGVAVGELLKIIVVRWNVSGCPFRRRFQHEAAADRGLLRRCACGYYILFRVSSDRIFAHV